MMIMGTSLGTLYFEQGSGRPGKLRELANTSGKSRKTWETPGILFEGNCFDFVGTLIMVSHALIFFFNNFVIFVLIVFVFIFIMQLPLYLNDLWECSQKK